MARDSIQGAPWEEAFRWQRPPRPEEPPEVRDVSVDPFSLRQFSRLDIDRPLPIPSVSVDDRGAHVSPPRFDGAAGAPGTAASSPRASVAAGGMKSPAAPTGLDDERPAAYSVSVASEARPTSKLSAGWEAELADAGLDVSLVSSPEKKASEPQRWGSDVPLIAAADAEYSFGRSKQAAKHAGRALFTCCMYVPGLTRRVKPPTSSTAAAAARSYSSVTFGKAAAAAVQPDDPGTFSARHSTVSLAVSLERFDCGSLSAPSSSSRGLGLDLDDGEAASSSSYFDLPLELILGCDDDGDESDQPVCAAFLFDSDSIRKSVLKRRLEAGAGMEPRRPSIGESFHGVIGKDVDPSRSGLLEVEVSIGVHIAGKDPAVDDKHVAGMKSRENFRTGN